MLNRQNDFTRFTLKIKFQTSGSGIQKTQGIPLEKIGICKAPSKDQSSRSIGKALQEEIKPQLVLNHIADKMNLENLWLLSRQIKVFLIKVDCVVNLKLAFTE